MSSASDILISLAGSCYSRQAEIVQGCFGVFLQVEDQMKGQAPSAKYHPALGVKNIPWPNNQEFTKKKIKAWFSLREAFILVTRVIAMPWLLTTLVQRTEEPSMKTGPPILFSSSN